jgi:protein-disulfide isomerase
MWTIRSTRWSRTTTILLKLLDVASAICVVLVSIAVLWVLVVSRTGSQNLAGNKPGDIVENLEGRKLEISTIDVATLRQEGATLALIEFSDFQCPFCARWANETLPQLKRDFVETGKLAYVLMHLPLENIHPRAFELAQAAVCAGDQARLWGMHDLLFSKPGAFSRVDLMSHARLIGLDEAPFNTCLDAEDAAARIRASMLEATRLDVTSTPTFFLGSRDERGNVRIRRRINGGHPYVTFRTAIEQLLQAT